MKNQTPTSSRKPLIDEVGSNVEVSRYVSGGHVHQGQAPVADVGAVPVVEVVGVHLGVAPALSRVEDVVDAHAPEERLVLCCDPVGVGLGLFVSASSF